MSTKMKRILTVLLALAMILACAGVTASADSSNVRVRVNGRSVTFNSDLGRPFINSNDRTMIPFRAVANFMSDVYVSWDDGAKEASFSRNDVPINMGGETVYASVAVHFPIGTNQAWQNIWLYDGQDELVASYSYFTQMDTLSCIVNDRTYAPIRYLAEALYCGVGWDDRTRTVLIDEPGDFATAFLEAEYNAPEHFIEWDYVARQYAYIFVRRTYHDFDPNVEYLGEKYGYLEGDETGWLFNCVVPGKMIYIYVNDEGETWYSEDDENYHIWE